MHTQQVGESHVTTEHIKMIHLSLAQLVEQRLCPRCSRPRFDSRPGLLCCVSLPLSLILFHVTSSATLLIKPYKRQKNTLKKKKKIHLSYTCPSGLPGQILILMRLVTFHFERAHSPLCALEKSNLYEKHSKHT